MDWITPYRASLIAVVNAAWPDLTALWAESQIEKIRWIDSIQRGQLVSPWCVYDFAAPKQTEDWGLVNCAWELSVLLYYIARDTGPDMKGTLLLKAMALQDALRADNSLQAIDNSMDFDAEPTNPVNASLLETNQPYTALRFSFTGIGGYTP